ncbi:BsuPI-related putative proteinase inhibitor [Radiobacillus sp. PE A8.2]|uniref:BsuPI-related putative proteinase inhibitor n=1 Tax=Radiobacillus sp. PE A8.2 TaxID=3380349 RepID=UPI00388F5290
MKKTMYFLLVVLFGLFLAGCGTSNADEGNQETENTNGSGNSIVAGKVVPTLTESSPLVYDYQVANQTEEEVVLEFTSSQRYDYAVSDSKGEQIYLYSSVASFMQVMGEEKMKQGEALQYSIDLHELNLSPGSYVLSAWMTPQGGEEYKVEHDFTIE